MLTVRGRGGDGRDPPVVLVKPVAPIESEGYDVHAFGDACREQQARVVSPGEREPDWIAAGNLADGVAQTTLDLGESLLVGTHRNRG